MSGVWIRTGCKPAPPVESDDPLLDTLRQAALRAGALIEKQYRSDWQTGRGERMQARYDASPEIAAYRVYVMLLEREAR